jgi:3-isopropylmalate/(R)-2-methylmalate dehydratase small subunit
MLFEGSAVVYGDHINTDLIIPGKYLNISDPFELATHAMAGVSPSFTATFHPENILVVGRNFGCGSSREQAAICLKYAGVQVIIGRSFARIFYRNAINQGIFVIESDEAVDGISSGDFVVIDVDNGSITNKTQQKQVDFTPLPDFLHAIIISGGLIPYLKSNKK